MSDYTFKKPESFNELMSELSNISDHITTINFRERQSITINDHELNLLLANLPNTIKTLKLPYKFL